MGLYDSFSLSIGSDAAKGILVLIGGVLVVLVLGWIVLTALAPQPLQVSLSGPIDLTTSVDGYPLHPTAELTITITNPNPEPVENVSVFVKPLDEKALVVFPSSIPIETLDKSRTLLVNVRPNPVGKVLSGTYQLEVTAVIGNQDFSQSVEVEIKNPETQQTR
jgi:hypothetical protein